MQLLFLNDFGTSELFFIMFAVLVLFGAKSIPSIAKTLGRGMREVKQASDEIKRDISRSAAEMRREMNVDKHLDTFKNPIKELQNDILKENPKPLKPKIEEETKPSPPKIEEKTNEKTNDE